jgi:hypothetical protein
LGAAKLGRVATWTSSRRPRSLGRIDRTALLGVAAAFALAAVTGLATVKLGSLQHQLKALLIVVAGVTAVIAALRPQIGLLILLAICPFELAFYGTNSNEVLLVLLALVLGWRIQTRAIPSWVLAGGLALIVGSLLAAIGAHSRSLALEGCLDWLCAIVILFVALSTLRERADASRRMVGVFVGSAVIVVVFGFLQKAGIYAIVGEPFNTGLPNSFFSYYTVYAGYVAVAATLATAEILVALEEHRVARAWLFGAAVVFMIVGLVASTSRGGALALGTGWLLLVVFNMRRAPVLGRLAFVIAAFAVAALAVTPHSTILTLEHRFAQSNGLLGEDKTRFAVQKAGEQALVNHPFGLGFGNFPYYVSSFVRNSHVHQPFFHAQETSVQVGLDSGWLGLAGFLTLVGGALVLVLKRAGGGTSAVRASGFAAALGGFMAQGLYDYVLWDLAFLVVFMALLWGLLHALQVDELADG